MITVSVLSPEYRSAGVKNMIKILIADDQELIRQSLQIVLNTKEDMEVIDTASNGQEVIQSIRKETPDVILMDIRMPKMDGGTMYEDYQGELSRNQDYYSDHF